MENRNNDAVIIAPEFHKPLFENEKVRVLEVSLPIGRKTQMHWHPQNVSYILQGGRMKIIKPVGAVDEVELISGKVMAGSEGEHIVENIGDSDIHTIQIEFI